MPELSARRPEFAMSVVADLAELLTRWGSVDTIRLGRLHKALAG